MKKHLPLIAGLLVAAAVPAGILAAGLMATSSPSSPEVADRAEGVAPVPSPDLGAALATTRPTSPMIERPAPSLAPAEAAPSFEPELRERGALRARRLIVASGVSRHEPLDQLEEVVVGEHARLYAFVDAANSGDDAGTLTVTFEPERGESAGHVELTIPGRSRRFRTWAYTRHVRTLGRWHAVVRDADGRVVARRPFDVVAPR